VKVKENLDDVCMTETLHAAWYRWIPYHFLKNFTSFFLHFS